MMDNFLKKNQENSCSLSGVFDAEPNDKREQSEKK